MIIYKCQFVVCIFYELHAKRFGWYGKLVSILLPFWPPDKSNIAPPHSSASCLHLLQIEISESLEGVETNPIQEVQFDLHISKFEG